jgi:hypothetical protein
MDIQSRRVLIVLMLLLVGSGTSGQPKQYIDLVHLTVGADSLSPSAPTAGQTLTVTFSVTSAIAFSGEVGGTFQDISLTATDGDTRLPVNLQPNQTLTGSMIFAAPMPASGEIILTIYPLPKPNCGAGLRGHAKIRACKTDPIQSASIPVTIAAPMTRVRIAGVGYSNIKRPDSKDGSTANAGYQCVVHDPGCGWWGNDGIDQFFVQSALPAGAKLESTQLIQYWPTNVASASGSGAWTWLNSSGSYYAKDVSTDAAHRRIKWNNTCWGGFGGKKLLYSISFIVSIPEGTDLGEPTADPASNPSSTCQLAGFQHSPVTETTPSGLAPSGWVGQVSFCNPTTASATYYLHIRAKLVTPYNDAGGETTMTEDNLPLQFAPGGSGGSSAVYRTSERYKRGSWQITDVYLTSAPTTPPDAQVKNPARLPSLPVSANLPGAPNFDFRGGGCL